ncbi:MAG: RagB/SusD family nutrient uptake outer membrane protein [Bacteroidetes bacterium]|nr:RagB/SusD family nutrient uptake outer membrane protein [Bacteroidota bacterium]
MRKTSINRYIFPAALLMMALLNGSCKKLIEIPSSPPTQIGEKDQYADSAAAMSAIAWVYTYAAGTTSGVAWNNGDMIGPVCLSSDELLQPSPYDASMTQFYNYSLSPINGSVGTIWSSPYTSLYVVNNVLANVTDNANMSASFRKQITAEMKVVRAFYYFQLVNMFGPVPVVTGIDYKVNAVLPRAPVDTVYAQIVSDLTSAKQNLMADYPSSGHVRPNQLVADAMLAKVYLYRNNWQGAYDRSNAVIGSGEYNLVTDPNEVFLDGSEEAIWQLPAAGPNNVTGDAMQFIPYSSGSVPPYIATTWLLNAFEPGDLRMQDWLTPTVANGNTVYSPFKYKNLQTPNAQTTEDYMMLRLGEQYLIRAEASAQLGNGAAALSDVNTVRARAGLAASTANPNVKGEVMNAIMHERQVELFAEWGNRWFDLKRTGTAVAVLGAEKPGFTATAQLYPVPQTELQNNIKLKQNPGY